MALSSISGTDVLSRRFILLLLILFSIPAISLAQLVNGRLITSIYTWEKFDTVGVSKMFGRGYQSVLLDVAQSGFSVHTHLQGAISLQKKLDETPDFRAWYLYARVKDIGDVADVNLGRFPFYAGVGSGTLDGALTSLRFAESKVRVTLYGGQNVPQNLGLGDWKPLRNNFAVGGQLLTTAIDDLRLGISYFNRRRDRDSYWTIRPDSIPTAPVIYVVPDANREQYGSVDATYRFAPVTVVGRYDYNLEASKTQRAQLGVRADIMDDLSFSGDFIHRAPRVAFNSFFGLFDAANIQEFEGGLDYRLSPLFRVFGRGALVSYDGDESFRYTVGAGHEYVYLSYRGNSGYAGELNSVTVQGVYPLFDRMLIPNASLSYTSYKLNQAAETDNALAGVLGATVRPIPSFSADVQVQWMQNKVFKNDVRLFAKLNYWFSERFHIFD